MENVGRGIIGQHEGVNRKLDIDEKEQIMPT
jgi:hypothetical protein